MKKIVLCAVLATAAITPLSANAAGEQTFCTGGAAGSSTVTATASTSDFVKVAFTPKCSANVDLVGNDRSTTLYTVGASSRKGKSRFGGSTAGGSVVGSPCAAATCSDGDTDAKAASDAAPQS